MRSFNLSVPSCKLLPFGETFHLCGCSFSKGSFLNFVYMEKLDSMFVHLAVPVTSSQSFPLDQHFYLNVAQ